jgi:hypothetical protein
MGTEINDLVADRRSCRQFLLQSKSALICANSYAHSITFFLSQFDAWSQRLAVVS